jgi:hypothetical protein
MTARHWADPRAFWEVVADQNPAWYVATGSTDLSDAFFAQGACETDYYLAFCGWH